MTRFQTSVATFAAVLLALPAASATTLYGVTATDLVSLNPATGASSIIGSLGMGASEGPGPLAWNPTDGLLYGLVYDYTLVGGIPVPVTQKLASINPLTAAVTVITDFGSRITGRTYDAIEFVDAYGSLVVSRSTGAGNTSTTRLTQVTTGGVLGTEITTTLDNDLLAYDTSRSILYSLDPNNATPLHQKVDTGTGVHTSLAGGIPSVTTGETAYDGATDRLYALDYTLGNKNLYTIDTAAGVGPASLVATVALSGNQVLGIAYTAVPEPGVTAAIAATALGLWAFLRRRA